MSTADSAKFETGNNLIINSLDLRRSPGIRSTDDATASGGGNVPPAKTPGRT